MSTQKQTIRETTAEWEYNDADGKLVTKEVTVVYKSPTVAQLRQQRVEAKQRFEQDPTAIVWISEELLPLVHSITDLPEGVKAPATMNVEWLDNQDVRNLKRVRDAIDADISLGKSTPA